MALGRNGSFADEESTLTKNPFRRASRRFRLLTLAAKPNGFWADEGRAGLAEIGGTFLASFTNALNALH